MEPWHRVIGALIVGAALVAVPGGGPASAATVFGLVDTGQVFASTNAGASWTVRGTLQVHDAVALLAGSDASELYLATRTGTVFQSEDAGVTWVAVGVVTASDVVGMAMLLGGEIFLLTESGTIHRSDDDGASFTAIAALQAPDFVAIARDGDDLFALTRTGLVERSTDSGVSWLPVGTIQTPEASSLRAFDGDLYSLSITGEIWRSADAGVTWLPIGTVNQVRAQALTDDGSLLITGTDAGSIATSPDGVAWSWVGTTNQVTLVALGVDAPQSASVAPGGPSPHARLDGPWPNPAPRASEAIFPITLGAGPTSVSLELFDVAGRLVARRAPEELAHPGVHTIRWNPDITRSGVYLARVRTRAGSSTTTLWVVSR